VVGAVGLLLAYLQYRGNRTQRVSERERLAQQDERLRNAVAGASSAAEMADLIVQRSKEPDVTITELQNVSRALRGSLENLAGQLDAERNQVKQEVTNRGGFLSRTS
jgi:hypothetical protein